MIKKSFPKALDYIDDIIEAAELPPLNIISENLVNGLDEIEQEFVLVLDDYHLIHNNDINELINQLLQFPPQLMHLLIMTRQDPMLACDYALPHFIN